MPERKFKVIPVTLVAVLLAVLGLAAYALFEVNRPVPRPPLPNPNGYDDFVKAGQTLVGDPGGYGTMTQGELRSLVATNATTLTLLRQGLTRHCRVALDFSTNYLGIRMPEYMATKKLVQLLVADGRLAEFEHRTNDAAKVYLQAIRFGNEAV